MQVCECAVSGKTGELDAVVAALTWGRYGDVPLFAIILLIQMWSAFRNVLHYFHRCRDVFALLYIIIRSLLDTKIQNRVTYSNFCSDPWLSQMWGKWNLTRCPTLWLQRTVMLSGWEFRRRIYEHFICVRLNRRLYKQSSRLIRRHSSHKTCSLILEGFRIAFDNVRKTNARLAASSSLRRCNSFSEAFTALATERFTSGGLNWS